MPLTVARRAVAARPLALPALLVALLAALLATPLAPALRAQGSADVPPPIPREFRAAWVASVANIDWPSRPGLSTWEQQAELLAILNRATALRLNAVVLQVRPAADALYESKLEPWSEYLTGDMGRAPEPAWDPLAFAVREAHARGLELHAWFNPFRAHHAAGTPDFASTHVSRTKASLVRQYGRWQWMDPGDAATREHSLDVILDVVRRYDIDGVHIDDYFYPYKERDARGRAIDFPDSASWAAYRREGGTLSRDDWRRRNVDRFVERLHARIKGAKPWVKVGISPFGIWRPGHPASVRGLDPYVELYADSRKWLRNGWLDYLSPQLYWPIAAPNQSYPVLLRWWVEENVKRRHIWPGNYTSRIGAADSSYRFTAGEVAEQIRLTRRQPGATGNVHFSMQALMANMDGIADSLLAGPYAAPALVPASPWLDHTPPLAPKASVRRDTVAGGWTLHLAPGGKVAPWLWVVRARYGATWTLEVLPAAQRTLALTRDDALPAPDVVTAVAVDRVGNESARTTVRPRERAAAGEGGNED
jgi:uncharacterized lipoprotein YddW (UPF0748 family)